jgi:hypothetical protein
MTKERMTTIWSLGLRRELAVRIYYAVESACRCRVLRLDRLEYFENPAE